MASIRSVEKNIGFKDGFYLLFVAKPEIKDKNFAEISKEVELLLQRAKVIK
jgi:RNase P protein component